MELLVAVILISLVFIGSTAVYISGLKFLRLAQQNDVSTSPVIAVEDITQKISFANDAALAGGQLTIRADYPTCSDFSVANVNSAANTADDRFWHYGFVNGALRSVCDAAAGTVVGAGSPILVSNVNIAASNFQINNPSGAGVPTVVRLHVVALQPALTLDTNAALGARSK